MNAVALLVRHEPQTQQPVVRRKEVDSSQYSVASSPLPPTQSSVLSPQHSVVVGRESELTQLRHLFEKVLRGERQVVFVSGEAGIGKTTLVDAFLARLRDRADVRITSGQCVEQYGPGEAYMPLLEATTRLCQGPGGERRVAALQRYAPSWLTQLPSLLEPQEWERLQQRARGTSRERMLRELAETAEGFSTTRPLVLVLEDLHWSDESTLDWVTYMARRREPAKLLILATYRPTEVLANHHSLHGVVQELQARGQCEVVGLAPFAEEAVVEYLAVRLHTNGATRHLGPRQFIPLLHQRTGGNPLFLVNTVDDLIRQGVFVEEAGRHTVSADAATVVTEGIPDTVRQLIERQLERLSETEQRLLEVASVAGAHFVVAEVAAGLQTDSETVELTCERLARAGQWLRATGIAEWPDSTICGRYSFLHAVHHEVVYARLAEVRRISLHRRITARKEAAYGERVREVAAELAVHCEKGRELTRAADYLGKAGENAVRRGAHQEAIAHLRRGLDILHTFPPTPERDEQELRLDLALVESLIATKGYGSPDVERAYTRARELCRQGGDPHQRLLVLWALSGLYLTRAELQSAQELGEQLLHLAHDVHDSALLPAAHLVLGQPLFHLGELVLAHAHLEQSTALYDRRTYHPAGSSKRDPGVASLCYKAWVLWLLGYPEQALTCTHAAFNLAQELNDPLEVAWALNYASGLHFFRREQQAAQEQAEAAIQLSTEREFPFWAAMGTLMEGWALAMQGRGEEGIARMYQGLATWQAMGVVVGQPGFLAMLAEAQGAADQVEEGLRTLADGFALVAKTGERYYEAELYRLKGELTLAGARGWGLGASSSSPQVPSLKPHASRAVEQEAEECFLKAIDIARSQEAKSLELRAAMSLARLWRQQGKSIEARALLEDIYLWFTEGFDTKDLQDAAALLCELGGVGTEVKSQKAKGRKQ